MTTQKFSTEAIAKIFTDAYWDYTYNMERIAEGDMQQIIAELEGSNFTEEDVKQAMGSVDLEDISKMFDEQNDIEDFNFFLAIYIADSIAWGKVECPYQTVSFSII